MAAMLDDVIAHKIHDVINVIWRHYLYFIPSCRGMWHSVARFCMTSFYTLVVTSWCTLCMMSLSTLCVTSSKMAAIPWPVVLLIFTKFGSINLNVQFCYLEGCLRSISMISNHFSFQILSFFFSLFLFYMLKLHIPLKDGPYEKWWKKGGDTKRHAGGKENWKKWKNILASRKHKKKYSCSPAKKIVLQTEERKKLKFSSTHHFFNSPSRDPSHLFLIIYFPLFLSSLSSLLFPI